ncbi:MAG: hypothetical protein OXU26_16700 [Acidobacteriota bacterium]|nr:hypothetical protein [Acidobacteriota bacterium]
MSLLPPWSGCSRIRVESLAAVGAPVPAATAAQPGLTAQAPAPVIEMLNPESGPVGTEIKIIRYAQG